MSNTIKTVGLFGTCGNSAWRAPFVARFAAEGVEFFNPQVDNWTPELASVEAGHLAGDVIVLMAVTGETTGAASLVEAGLMVARAVLEPDKRFLLFVEPEADASLEGAKDSNRARRLLLEHLSHFRGVRNLYCVDSLDAMQELALLLWEKLEA